MQVIAIYKFICFENDFCSTTYQNKNKPNELARAVVVLCYTDTLVAFPDNQLYGLKDTSKFYIKEAKSVGHIE